MSPPVPALPSGPIRMGSRNCQTCMYVATRHARILTVMSGHAALGGVPGSTLGDALSQCTHSAIPWGQCGGSSACPSFLAGACLDQPWGAVCCPPSGGYHQVCWLLCPTKARSVHLCFNPFHNFLISLQGRCDDWRAAIDWTPPPQIHGN